MSHSILMPVGQWVGEPVGQPAGQLVIEENHNQSL